MIHVVITGATKGIGRAIAHHFAKEGANIYFCARSKEAVENMQQELAATYPSQTFWGQSCDVSDKAAIISFAQEVLAQTSHIHVLVNNAGIFLPGRIDEEADGVFEQQWNTNIASAYHLTRALLPAIPRDGNGYIFNMCSTASIMAYPNGGSYCISKFALLGFSKVLRENLKSSKIRVTSILPGATLTDSWNGTDLPRERFMQPEDIAAQIISCWKLPHQTVVEELLLRPMEGDI